LFINYSLEFWSLSSKALKMALRGVTLHGPLHPIEKGVKNFLSLGFSVTKTYKINGNLPPKMSSSYSILLISETLEKGGQIFPVPVIFFRPNDNESNY